MAALVLSSEELHSVLRQIEEISLEYLKQLDVQPSFPEVTGQESCQAFGGELPERGLGLSALDAIGEVLRFSRAQNGRFFGYVMGSAEPVSAFADLVASVINQNVTSWRSAPAATAIERTVVSWLAEAIGCRGFSGYLTGGGSTANLMGLALAREALAPAAESGTHSGVVYASTEAHMSIPKAMGLLGLGRSNLRLVEVDSGFRMRPDLLETAVESDLQAGRLPLAVVATAGTVNTGAIDPLREIAEIASRHKLWLHVDGAYGALAAIAVPGLFDGLNLADSVSLDPHKWLYQPLDCGCLLYRNPEIARRAFSFSGEYAKPLAKEAIEGFAFFDESVELSRRFRALKLWLSLRYHGFSAFREAIRRDIEHAGLLVRRIQDNPRLELVATGPLCAVCFRYVAGAAREKPAEQTDQQNEAILQRVIERQRVYLSNARIHGRFTLRACFVNHRTTPADVEELVSEILGAGSEIAG
jgi:aromatic-L-amino-acid decarboxylase